jgi:hypothetical protein
MAASLWPVNHYVPLSTTSLDTASGEASSGSMSSMSAQACIMPRHSSRGAVWLQLVRLLLDSECAQGSVTFTSRAPRTSTRCIIEPPWTCEAPCHFTLLVTYQTPSGTFAKEKLPEGSQRVVRSVET